MPVPRQSPPNGAIHEYTRDLVGLVARTRAVFQPVAQAMPDLTASVRRERLIKDAGEGRRLHDLLAQFQSELAFAITDDRLFDLATKIAGRISEHNRLQLFRQARAAIGVDLFFNDRGLQSELEGFVTRNVALIKEVPATVATKVEGLVTDGIARGRRWRDIAPDITNEWSIGRQRAQLIARDQVLTGYGRVNAHRQRELGVTHFVWRTVGDRRVRGKPGGAYPNTKPSHDARNGVTYSYVDPPGGELPGEPVLCRCTAEPVFE